MKHTMVKMLCGQLYFAPISEHPHEVLDIGTGTGIWAIESMWHDFGAHGDRANPSDSGRPVSELEHFGG